MQLRTPTRRPGATSTVATWLAWLVFAAFGAVHVYMAVRLPGGPDGMSDLRVYTGAVRTLLDGGSLYRYVAGNGDGFLYPPFAALAWVPMALLPEAVPPVLWTALQAAQVAALAWLVVGRTPWPRLARLPRRVAVPAVAALLMLSYPVFSGLFLGQVSLLVTLLALVDAVDLTPRWLRGVPTGLAAAIKLTPLAFVPYLWLTGRRRAAVVAAGTFGLAGVLAWVVAPGASADYWRSNQASRSFLHLGQADNASLVGLLTRLQLTGTVREAVLGVIVVGVVWWVYRRSRDCHRRGQVLAGAVIVGAMAVLVSPISWSHHQVVLVLAGACAVAGSRRWTLWWSVAVGLLTSVPAQAVLLHLTEPPALLRESSVLLGVAVACLVPFAPPHTPAARPPGAGAARTQPSEHLAGTVRGGAGMPGGDLPYGGDHGGHLIRRGPGEL